MNEKYLWDKTGEDTDIELLENALQTFRYRETAPPALPAKIIPFAPKTSRRFAFRFRFAFAACVVLCAAVFAVWLNVSKPIPAIKIETAQKNVLPTQNTAPILESPKINEPDDSMIAKTNVPNVKKFAAPKFAGERTIVEKPKTVRVKITENAAFVKNNQPKESRTKLTHEEKYAYDQLMLALSITSSNLKIVKDKVGE